MLMRMAAIEDHPQMQVEEFEALAEFAARTDDGPRLEFVRGKLGVKPVPDGHRGNVIAWLMRTFSVQLPELWFYPGQGLKIELYRAGRARPDGVLAREGAFLRDGEWADPGQVLLAVEVTSFDADSHRRDCVDKVLSYAEAGIPVYLLIDRSAGALSVYSDPRSGGYQRVAVHAFGEVAGLPAPLNVEIDTARLAEWGS